MLFFIAVRFAFIPVDERNPPSSAVEKHDPDLNPLRREKNNLRELCVRARARRNPDERTIFRIKPRVQSHMSGEERRVGSVHRTSVTRSKKT